LKKPVVIALIVIAFFVIALNSAMIADQAISWVKENPKDVDAPIVLYRAARWCDIMGDNKKATAIYLQLYQQYPEKGDLCAPALYYVADIMANDSNITVLRQQSVPYLEIILSQYSAQGDWPTKAKQLLDEVKYVR
jgi:hypothetical protein